MFQRYLINNMGDVQLFHVCLFFGAAIGLVYGIDYLYKKVKQKK